MRGDLNAVFVARLSTSLKPMVLHRVTTPLVFISLLAAMNTAGQSLYTDHTSLCNLSDVIVSDQIQTEWSLQNVNISCNSSVYKLHIDFVSIFLLYKHSSTRCPDTIGNVCSHHAVDVNNTGVRNSLRCQCEGKTTCFIHKFSYTYQRPAHLYQHCSEARDRELIPVVFIGYTCKVHQGNPNNISVYDGNVNYNQSTTGKSFYLHTGMQTFIQMARNQSLSMQVLLETNNVPLVLSRGNWTKCDLHVPRHTNLVIGGPTAFFKKIRNTKPQRQELPDPQCQHFIKVREMSGRICNANGTIDISCKDSAHVYRLYYISEDSHVYFAFDIPITVLTGSAVTITCSRWIQTTSTTLVPSTLDTVTVGNNLEVTGTRTVYQNTETVPGTDTSRETDNTPWSVIIGVIVAMAVLLVAGIVITIIMIRKRSRKQTSCDRPVSVKVERPSSNLYDDMDVGLEADRSSKQGPIYGPYDDIHQITDRSSKQGPIYGPYDDIHQITDHNGNFSTKTFTVVPEPPPPRPTDADQTDHHRGNQRASDFYPYEEIQDINDQKGSRNSDLIDPEIEKKGDGGTESEANDTDQRESDKEINTIGEVEVIDGRIDRTERGEQKGGEVSIELIDNHIYQSLSSMAEENKCPELSEGHLTDCDVKL